MKDFITAIASVIILMMFLMQFTANQLTFTKIMGAEYAVRELRLISENQGIIKSESIALMKEKIAAILNCSAEEVAVSLDGAAVDIENTGEQPVSCSLKVQMPVFGIIGPAGILGLTPEENVRTHISEGIIVLRPLAPQENESEGESGDQ